MCGSSMNGNRESSAVTGNPSQSGGRRPEAVVLHVRCRAVGQVHMCAGQRTDQEG